MGCSVNGILQARILELVAISSSRASSPPGDWPWVSCIAGRFLTDWLNKKASVKALNEAVSQNEALALTFWHPCSLPKIYSNLSSGQGLVAALETGGNPRSEQTFVGFIADFYVLSSDTSGD